eukprot:CAMPEP_0203792522 /NCGR_PEP_ID=MMETSP0100_2-20121128/5304_1 /ASSEMBLY_ACC=CAM_ASM_000210 /TAXON_ID=96639 /ORGANISM=" , Strain NY0313808BC1" /LENGTH=59 /DNA_ID=CAMNT_0050696095 /DNA_START=494 /DNA_END=673 /DNA_ORIENTATION=-
MSLAAVELVAPVASLKFASTMSPTNVLLSSFVDNHGKSTLWSRKPALKFVLVILLGLVV